MNYILRQFKIHTFFYISFVIFFISNSAFAQVYRANDLPKILLLNSKDSMSAIEYNAAIEFHNLLNEYRKSNGLLELSFSDKLLITARNHSLWMAENKKLSHTENIKSKNFTGKNPGDRLKFVAKDKCAWTGENCLFNYSYDDTKSIEANAKQIAKESLDQWKLSSGHNKNMLGEHVSQATSFIIDKNGIVWATTLFGMCE